MVVGLVTQLHSYISYTVTRGVTRVTPVTPVTPVTRVTPVTPVTLVTLVTFVTGVTLRPKTRLAIKSGRNICSNEICFLLLHHSSEQLLL